MTGTGLAKHTNHSNSFNLSHDVPPAELEHSAQGERHIMFPAVNYKVQLRKPALQCRHNFTCGKGFLETIMSIERKQ